MEEHKELGVVKVTGALYSLVTAFTVSQKESTDTEYAVLGVRPVIEKKVSTVEKK